MMKENIKRLRRKLFESLGMDHYSWPALNDIDKKLEKYFPYSNGFFVEAGANDGFKQSNTYYLERFRGWRGILVEAIPELYQKCVKERLKSTVFNCALVPHDYEGSSIEMIYADLMSLVKGAQKSVEADVKHIARGCEIQSIDSYKIHVPARTLTSILDECNVKEIDLLSLDVEGYELNVLKGLDFNKYRPKYMLIEARFRQEIEEYILEFYTDVDQLSFHDYLYKRK